MMKVVSIKKVAQDPNIVLEKSIDQYESVLVLGYNHEGQLDVRSSLNLSHENTLWLIKMFERNLLNGDYHG